MTTAISAQNLTVYGKEGPKFREVSIQLERGEAIALTSVGPADLSALLEVLAGLKRPVCGSVSWNMLPALSVLNDKSATLRSQYKAVRWLRQSNAFVSDSVSLLNDLTVFENIALPLRYHFNAPEKVVRERSHRLMEHLKLMEVANERPAYLSLGIHRRTALGRALILEPTSLFMESPLSNIDDVSGEVIISVLKHYLTRVGLSIIVSSFDALSLLPLVSRVIVFYEGTAVKLLSGDDLEEARFFEHLNHLQKDRRIVDRRKKRRRQEDTVAG